MFVLMHCVWEKSKPQTILDRNVKSQRILRKLCAQNSESIIKKLQNFVRKYLLTTALIFKCRRQNISVFVTSSSAVTGLEVTFAGRTTLYNVKTVHLLIREIPDFIAPTL